MSDEVTRHYHEMRCYALRLTRNGSDADDLVQETMFKALRAWDPADPWSNPRAWLYRAMYNTFVSHVRKHRGRLAPFDSLDEEGCYEWVKDDVDLASGVDGRDLIARVAEFIETMPPKQRRAWLLRHQRGYEFKQICEEMGTTIQAARSSVHQVTLKLRETFDVPWRCD